MARGQSASADEEPESSAEDASTATPSPETDSDDPAPTPEVASTGTQRSETESEHSDPTPAHADADDDDLVLTVGVRGAVPDLQEEGTETDEQGEMSPAADDDDGKTVDPDRLEWAVLPFAAFQSNLGVLIGLVANFTKFAEDADPFVWQVMASSISSIAVDAPGGDQTTPLQRLEVVVRLMQLLDGRLRLEMGVFGEGQSNVGYHGIGNATNATVPEDYTGPEGRYFQLNRGLIEGRVRGWYALTDTWALTGSLVFHYVEHFPYSDSKLARDRAAANDEGRPILRGVRPGYASPTLSLGVWFDTRDNELNPEDGVLAESSLRMGYSPDQSPSILWGSFYLNVRGFVRLVPRHLVLAMRGVADVGFGDMPLVQLGRLGGFTSFGGVAGPRADRGLPAGRLHGMVRLLGSAELRWTFWRDVLGGVPLSMGAVGFSDVSRVFSRVLDVGDRGAVDGRGLGLYSTVGAGFRVGWGEATTLRLDFALGFGSGIDDGIASNLIFEAGHAF